MRRALLVSLILQACRDRAPIASKQPRTGHVADDAAASDCAIGGERDLLAFLREHGCIVATPGAGAADAPPADLAVELVRGGPAFYDMVSFRVRLVNRGGTAIPLELTVDDQRLCFTGTGGGFPTHACELLSAAPAGAAVRARLILAPHAVAYADGLGFIKHTAVERDAGSGAVGFFEEPLPPGAYDFVATVPLAFRATPPAMRVLHTSVTVP